MRLGLTDPAAFDAIWYAFVFEPAREAEADPQDVVNKGVRAARGNRGA